MDAGSVTSRDGTGGVGTAEAVVEDDDEAVLDDEALGA
jgi:hypothetical protein